MTKKSMKAKPPEKVSGLVVRLRECFNVPEGTVEDPGFTKALYKIAWFAYRASRRLKEARMYCFSEIDEEEKNEVYWRGKYYESLYYEQVNGYMDLINQLWLLGIITEATRRDAVLLADAVAKSEI